ncbi:MAG TPA: hypothetical protein VJ765_03610 [Chitinophagaceae bacterium]|nr:hypothetical protein [Chitinophagaceae bacterium]
MSDLLNGQKQPKIDEQIVFANPQSHLSDGDMYVSAGKATFDGSYFEDSILKVLVYFSIFEYPLTQEEIKFFLDKKIKHDQLTFALENLKQTGCIWSLDEFYSLQNNHALVDRRRNGNRKAGQLLAKASQITKLLYQFPYVRAIGISGSLSKNFADENADIDYFVITKANRLWIARTLMHLFKKLTFLTGRQHLFCMNYYMDEADLQIEEKNIYTATELVTLMPMAGNGSMKRFFETNQWALSFFPNQQIPDVSNTFAIDNWLKKTGEFLFDNRLGNWLDNYLMRVTSRRWKIKEEQKRRDTKGERMGLKTSKHCSKPNPIFFHDWFLNKYEKRILEIDEKLKKNYISCRP